MSSLRSTVAQVTRYLAMAGGTLCVVQFALAGFGAFGNLKHHKDWGPHELVGTIIGIVSVLVVIAALIARVNARTQIRAFVLFLLAGPIQPLLAAAGKNQAWVGGLHALVGLGILAMFGLLSMKVAGPTPTAGPTATAGPAVTG
jgi:Family of unknown function (DUF6220)